MPRTYTRVPGLWSLGLLALVFVSCSADREKIRKELREEQQADFEKRVKEEVERRVAAELRRIEERQSPKDKGKEDGKEPRDASAGAAGSRAPDRQTPGEAPRDQGARAGAEPAGGQAPPSGSLALPPDAMEAKAPEVDPQGLVLNRVLLAKNLVERKPEGEGTAFTLSDQRIYCYIDAKNPKGPERKLTVVWHHDGKVFHKLALRVGVGYVWRTWAYLSVRPGHEGNWRCGVFNEEEQLIRSADFTITK
ncbi:MAG: DUF2914 domain-containing protein [Polyangia bacterium]|nr:DUF2914 domain-containing protein [Polyangia bacterium]